MRQKMSSKGESGFGHRPQTVAGQTISGPFFHGFCLQREIEVDAGAIPVKARPLQSAAAPLQSDLRQLFQKRLTVALAPVLRQHEQILQIDACPAQEGGEIMEEQGEAHLTCQFCDQVYDYTKEDLENLLEEI